METGCRKRLLRTPGETLDFTARAVRGWPAPEDGARSCYDVAGP
jgi:hypothetical protein